MGVEQRKCLIKFLRQNADILALSHEDMRRIDPSVIVHCLNIDRDFKPLNQKRQTFNQD